MLDQAQLDRSLYAGNVRACTELMDVWLSMKHAVCDFRSALTMDHTRWDLCAGGLALQKLQEETGSLEPDCMGESCEQIWLLEERPLCRKENLKH